MVKVFASRDERQRNAVVIAHELLHTPRRHRQVRPQTLQPIHPDGYAEPNRQPPPPGLAEIMAGRILVLKAAPKSRTASPTR